MKKLGLVFCGIFFLTTLCFAQNYYALVEVLIKNDEGLFFTMNTITRTPDQQACAKVLFPIKQLKGKYQLRCGCLSGEQWDKRFEDIFTNQSAASIYIAYQDLNGYETRINTKVLAGADSVRPGMPVDPPINEVILWASSMIDTLEKGGINGAKIIYPRKIE